MGTVWGGGGVIECLIREYLGRIQDLTKGGSDKRLPKAVAPRGVRDMLPRKIFNFMASEMRFPAFSGAI